MSLGSNHLEDSLQRMAQYQFQNAKTSSVHSQGRSRMLHICSVVWPDVATGMTERGLFP